MNDLVLIRKSLFRRKVRAALMIASILISFAIFGVLAAFERAFHASQDLAAGDRLVVVNKINFTHPLPIAYYNRVRAVEGVRQVTHLNWFGADYQDPKNFLVVLAVQPESYLELYENELDVNSTARAAFVRERTGALVGESMARKWGWKIGDHIPMSSRIFAQQNGSHTWDFTIVGTFKPKTPQVDTNFMVFQYAYLEEARLFSKGTIGWMALRTTSPEVNDKIIKMIDQMFANSSDETVTDTEKAFNKAFVAQLANVALIVELVVSAAFITILMIVGNTLIMALRERTREIAVLKTLGFPPERILRLVVGESLLLAFLGGLPGLGLAFLAAAVLGDRVANFVPRLVISPEIAAAALALMVCFGLATGIIPAINAMRLKIATALGRE